MFECYSVNNRSCPVTLVTHSATSLLRLVSFSSTWPSMLQPSTTTSHWPRVPCRCVWPTPSCRMSSSASSSNRPAGGSRTATQDPCRFAFSPHGGSSSVCCSAETLTFEIRSTGCLKRFRMIIKKQTACKIMDPVRLKAPQSALINRAKPNSLMVQPSVTKRSCSLSVCLSHAALILLLADSLSRICDSQVSVCFSCRSLGLAVSRLVCGTVSASASVPLAAPGSPQKTRGLQVRGHQGLKH